MTRINNISGKELVRALQRLDFIIRRQRGSHIILVHKDDLRRRCVVPLHGSSPIKPGTLRSILRGAQISSDQLLDLI